MNQPEDAQRIEYRNDWNGDAPPREWIWKDWLNHRLTLFTGHGGAGKSYLALQLAAAVASKARCSWIPPDPGASDAALTISSSDPVLIASWEDEEDEVHRRLSSMAETLPWAATDWIEDRLHFADLADRGPLWNNGKRTDVGHLLQTTAREIGARLLIIDPRAAAYAGDENHRAQVRAFISHWDRWARDDDHKCAVLLIDHLPKSAVLEQFSRGAAYAGSTDWYNASRCVWNIDDKLLLRCDKSNYGATPPPVKLSRKEGAWTGRVETPFGSGTTAGPMPATRPRNPYYGAN